MTIEYKSGWQRVWCTKEHNDKAFDSDSHAPGRNVKRGDGRLGRHARVAWVAPADFRRVGACRDGALRTCVLVLGYWVGARRPFHLSLFLTASRMVLPKILVLIEAKDQLG